MAYAGLCNCCSSEQATRMCLSCDPTAETIVYMCMKCSDRAHFGPMKLSHRVKSLVNMASRERLLESHQDWATERRRVVAECIQELRSCVNDLEHQKRIDLEIMGAAFDPLKNAVINRKRELTAQIVSHYDNMKPSLASVMAVCEQRLNIIESMTEFNSSSIRELLPDFGDGHSVAFPPDFNLDATVKQILRFELKTTPPGISADLVNSLTLTSGDVVDAISDPMDNEGIFWLKRQVIPETFAPLCQLSIKCRQDLIMGLRKRYHENPQDLHTGMIVMANLPGDDIWRRAVIADPCVRDKPDQYGSMASIVVVDTGIKRNLYHNRLAVCTNDCLNIPFLSFPCSLYPDEHDSLGVEPRWLFNDLIKEEEKGKPKTKVLKAKIVHKKNPQHVVVPVWYVQLTDAKNPDASINNMIEEKRISSSMSKGAILHKDIRVVAGEIAPSTVQLCSMKDSTPHDIIANSGATSDSGATGHPGDQAKTNEPVHSLFDGYEPANTQQNESTLPPQQISETDGREKPVFNPSTSSSPEVTNSSDNSIQQLTVSSERSLPAADACIAASPLLYSVSSEIPENSEVKILNTDASKSPDPESQNDLNDQQTVVDCLDIGEEPLSPPNKEETTVISPCITSQDKETAIGSSDVTTTTVEDVSRGFYCRDSSASVYQTDSTTKVDNTVVIHETPTSTSSEPAAGDAETVPVDAQPVTSETEAMFNEAEAVISETEANGAETTADQAMAGNAQATAGSFEVMDEDAEVTDGRAETTANGAEATVNGVEPVNEGAEDKGNEEIDGGEGESSNSTGSPTEVKIYEEWQESSTSLGLATKSDEAVFKRPKKKSKKNKRNGAHAGFDSASDPGSSQFGRNGTGRRASPSRSCTGDGNDSGFNRLPKVTGQSAIRSWINSPGRSFVGGLPALTSIVGDCLPGDVASTMNKALNLTDNQVPTTVAAADSSQAGDSNMTTPDSTAPPLPAPVTTQADDCGWQEPAMAVNPPPNQQPLSNSYPNQGRRGGGQAACYECGSTSHWVRDCPTRASRQRHSTVVCCLCNEQHMAEQCPVAKQWYLKGGCPYCMTSNHRMRDCHPKDRHTPNIAFKFLQKPHYGKRGNHW